MLLRNKIDSIMCAIDSTWLDNVPSKIEIDKPKNEPNPTHDKLVSFQSLGFWVTIAEHYKLESKLFDKDFLDSLDFKRYYAKNANRFKDKANLQNYQKANLLIHLLRNLRNRAFHAENLSKLDKYNKPVIWSRFGQGIFRVDSQHIERFIRDTLELFGIDIKVRWGTQKSPKAVE